MKRIIAFVALMVFFAALNAQPANDLFFSEYIEAEGNNRALELFNPTGITVNLNGYQITCYKNGNNGLTGKYSTPMRGFVRPGETFVLVICQNKSTVNGSACNAELLKHADQVHRSFPNPDNLDENDAIALETTNGELIDLIGSIGKAYNQPESSLHVPNRQEINWDKNFRVIRKPFVKKWNRSNYEENSGLPMYFNTAAQWDTLAANDWSSLGQHPYWINALQPKMQGDQFSIYPNPATSNRFYINAMKQIREVEIMTIVGQSIYKKTKARPSPKLRIQLSQSRSGIFLVKLKFTDDSYAVSKVMLSGQG